MKCNFCGEKLIKKDSFKLGEVSFCGLCYYFMRNVEIK